MGAIADAFVAFAQPLLDETDGSLEQVNKAFAIGQLCYNLALLPEDDRPKVLAETQRSLNMNDEQFDAFQSSIVIPMIRRHQEMFPFLHRRVSLGSWLSDPLLESPARTAAAAEKYPGTDRYAPCPCNSGEKYKFCCGKRGR
jgi:hypothetical protein